MPRRSSQQKYFLWFAFPIANCSKILMSYSEDWITQLIHWKTHILDIKINLQYSISLWAIIASQYKENWLILSSTHSAYNLIGHCAMSFFIRKEDGKQIQQAKNMTFICNWGSSNYVYCMNFKIFLLFKTLACF